jgi:hypothetical protein
MEVHEDEAVDVLARQYGVLLIHNCPFGAPQYTYAYNHMYKSIYTCAYIYIYMYVGA